VDSRFSGNRFQLGSQLQIILHPPLDLLPLFGPNAELANPPAWMAHGENPNPVTLTSTALQTPAAMEDLAIQERSPHILCRIGQLRS
jgi:hypothetical protein